MIDWFDDKTESDSSEDLPWLKEFVKGVDVSGTIFPVWEIYESPKGLLVITNRFKVFIFKRQKMYGFLTEALTVWLKDTTVPSHLVCKATNDGGFSLGVDKSNDVCYWTKENGHYTKKLNDGAGLQSEVMANPLLPPDMGYKGAHQTSTAHQEVSLTKRRSTKP